MILEALRLGLGSQYTSAGRTHASEAFDRMWFQRTLFRVELSLEMKAVGQLSPMMPYCSRAIYNIFDF